MIVRNMCRLGARPVVLAATLLATLCSAHAENRGLADVFREPAAGSKVTIDHSAWTSLLSRFVHVDASGLNRVDYVAFKRDGHGALKAYIRALQAADPRTLDRNEQFAYLANLYNAKTIDVVLDAYPVVSIKDISLGGGLFASIVGGPWKAKVVRVAGIDASLDDIEHGVLRTVFRDPRVHYAVNCASVGCPNLGTEALTGAKLDQQLDAAARAYVNHSRGVRASGDGFVVSSIYDWFKSDFGGNDAGVLQHLQKYATGDLAARLKARPAITEYAYDWSLNDVSR